MAPLTSRIPRRRPHSKKRVKFAKSNSPIVFKKSTDNEESYANIVLYYLSKLKGLFVTGTGPDKKQHIGDSSKMRLGSKPILKKDLADGDVSKYKAHDIVQAALQYGCANNIIERIGDYFLLRKISRPEMSLSVTPSTSPVIVASSTDDEEEKEQLRLQVHRRPTPGPDYIRCASCKSLTPLKTLRSFRPHHHYHHGYRKKYGGAHLNYCTKCYRKMKSKF